MSRSRQAAGILLVAVFGLWGCTRAPSTDSSNATAEKLKVVETKLARLEEDFRAAASARDQLSKRLTATEEERTALQGQVATLTKDNKAKDEQLSTRTQERDQVAQQHKVLKDGLKDLLAKMEPETKPEGSTAVPVIPTSNLKGEVPTLPAIPSETTPGK
jgi:septal ring factor EnvC (AmiA/AmiB activator)